MSNKGEITNVLTSQCAQFVKYLNILRLQKRPTVDEVVQMLEDFEYDCLKSSCGLLRKLSTIYLTFLMYLIISDEESPLEEILVQAEVPFKSRGKFIYISLGQDEDRQYHQSMGQRNQKLADLEKKFLTSQLLKREGVLYNYEASIMRADRTGIEDTPHPYLLFGVCLNRVLENLTDNKFLECLPDPESTCIFVYCFQGSNSIGKNLIKFGQKEPGPKVELRSGPFWLPISNSTMNISSKIKDILESIAISSLEFNKCLVDKIQIMNSDTIGEENKAKLRTGCVMSNKGLDGQRSRYTRLSGIVPRKLSSFGSSQMSSPENNSPVKNFRISSSHTSYDKKIEENQEDGKRMNTSSKKSSFFFSAAQDKKFRNSNSITSIDRIPVKNGELGIPLNSGNFIPLKRSIIKLKLSSDQTIEQNRNSGNFIPLKDSIIKLKLSSDQTIEHNRNSKKFIPLKDSIMKMKLSSDQTIEHNRNSGNFRNLQTNINPGLMKSMAITKIKHDDALIIEPIEASQPTLKKKPLNILNLIATHISTNMPDKQVTKPANLSKNYKLNPADGNFDINHNTQIISTQKIEVDDNTGSQRLRTFKSISITKNRKAKLQTPI